MMDKRKEIVRRWRWEASISYRTSSGKDMRVDHLLEEIHELDGLVEHGPHFDTIININIKRINHVTSPTLTIEEAREV